MSSGLPPEPANKERVNDERSPSHENPADSLLDGPEEQAGQSEARSVSPVLDLPEIPAGDLQLDLDSILNPSKSKSDPDSERVKKRASNVLKLSQENDKLKEELKAMQERLERAEARREQLARKQQQVMEPPSS
ncbi:hypothetical protein MSAN_00994800 [Mycena sanguinolenta]|uniref:Uncharacterized protein n=1 Tax=Mycena sanguinolenta TaxID=230812 RepID=A0A8H6YRC6_9AGAR|nr:hypothetical protein MSAN_00994800 [Mycena sanguinolenta]